MDYRVFYTKRSLGDLQGIMGWVANDDPAAASRFGTALLDHVDLLGRFPRMGALYSPRSRVRKLVHGRILVYYKIHEEKIRVEVLHFRHGSRKPAKF